MMIKPEQSLLEMKPSGKFLVAVDSDGCAFDAMGIKQRECFCPMMIGYFGLQPVAEAARECKMFADLFSKTRGANRHKTIVRILTELLPSHPKVKQRNFKVPQFEHYFQWVNDPNSLLSNDGLEKAIQASSNPDERKEFELALTWSRRVNEMVAEIVKDVPLFPYVRQSLHKASAIADIIVCSATPTEAIEREWAEHDLRQYIKVVAGQETGSKAEHLAIVSQKYDVDKIIMLGDALGDLDAAKQNNVLFYPIIPGAEEASWKRFYDEAFNKFMNGIYAGAYAESLITVFENALPDTPPWQRVEM